MREFIRRILFILFNRPQNVLARDIPMNTDSRVSAGCLIKSGMMKLAFLTPCLIILLVFICSCSTKAIHPNLKKADMPDLIPVRDLFLNVDSKYGYQISPDGEKMAWLAVKKRRITIHFKRLDSDKVEIIDSHSPRSIQGIAWLPDSRRMLFHQDQQGNENYHVYLVDTQFPDQSPMDLTPFENTRASLFQIIRSDTRHVLITHNQRNKEVFDLYRIDLATHEQTMIARNPGTVSQWITDETGSLRGRIRKNEAAPKTKRWSLEIADSDQQWRPFIRWSLKESVSFKNFTPDDNGMWLLSNRNRDKIALVRLDLTTGEEIVVYEDPIVDLQFVMISHLTRKPILVGSHPNHPHYYFFDRELEADLKQVVKKQPAGFSFQSMDYQERKLPFTVYTDKGLDYLMLDRNTHQKISLGQHWIKPYAHSLSDMQPINFQARDGMTLYGYLTLPKGTHGQKLPMVLFVHGGPWDRDYWGLNEPVQFLANRGYAVLQVNYRGSAGYGRTYMEAAIGEFAGKMHDDLIDGVNWTIDRGIADPSRIGIFGGSYGGYATLVGLTFTPDTFACGVDMVGPSNLISLLEAVPDYWKLWMDRFYEYVGNPSDPEDRKIMEAKSPIFRVDNIKKPLLIAQGGNDPRVKQIESDQMVAALRKAGKEVEYLLAPDEGHGFRFWKNRLRFYRKTEDFLAKHLGGRSNGFDYYQIGLLIY